MSGVDFVNPGPCPMIPPSSLPHLVDRPSPNHGPRPDGATIELIIVHYTDMVETGEAMHRLCDPETSVSAHYLIDYDGTTIRLVPEDRRAWHAGESSWQGRSDVNSRSIGIELSNPGHRCGYRPYPAAQMEALTVLVRDIMGRHGLPSDAILGHSDIAPVRKKDPGELFDWDALASRGIGLFPPPFAKAAPQDDIDLGPGADGPMVMAVQRLLAGIGYDIAMTGIYDDTTAAVVLAFQRHFQPWSLTGRVNRDLILRGTWLLEAQRILRSAS